MVQCVVLVLMLWYYSGKQISTAHKIGVVVAGGAVVAAAAAVLAVCGTIAVLDDGRSG